MIYKTYTIRNYIVEKQLNEKNPGIEIRSLPYIPGYGTGQDGNDLNWIIFSFV